MTTQSNNMIFIGLEDIIINKPNPRFAGLEYNSMDPVPYGNAIEEMYNSMVEHYNKHSVLLMQPVVVTQEDGKYSVNAGYTRAVTFITRYNDLCNALNVESLQIPCIVYESIDVVDSLMENIVRNEQHFLTIAHAIDSISEYKNIKNIAHQLGMTTDTARKLKTLVKLVAPIKKLCYNNVIDANTAHEIVKLDVDLQYQIAEYIEEHDITQIKTAGLNKILNYIVPGIIRGMYTGEFVDNNGYTWLSIENDSNYYMFNMEWKVVDEEQMIKRLEAYNDMIIQKYNLKVLQREEVNVYSGYVKVELGTYPNEIAVYNYDNVIEFYAKESDVVKVKNIEKYIEDKKEMIATKTDNKLFAIKNAKINELVNNEITLAFNSGDFDNDYLYQYVVKDMMFRMTSKQKEMFKLITEQEFNEENVFANDAINTLALCKILSAGYISADHKKLMEEYDISYDYFVQRVNEEIEDEKEEIKSKKHDKLVELDDTIYDIKQGLLKIQTTFFTNRCDSLFDDLVYNFGHTDEKILKYISKNINQPFKGNSDIMKHRLKNVVNSLNSSLVEMESLSEITEARNNYNLVYGIIKDELLAIDTYDNETIINTINIIVDNLTLNGFITDTVKVKWKTDEMLKALTVSKIEFNNTFFSYVWENLYKYMNANFNVIYFAKSGKLTILDRS